MRFTRRTVVKTSGLAALFGNASLAGCSGVLPQPTAGSRPRDWQYDPRVLEETPNVIFGTAAYDALHRNRHHLPEALRERLESRVPAPLDPAAVDAVAGVVAVNFSDYDAGTLTFGSITVLGSFERAAVERTVRIQGTPDTEREYQGFTLYEGVDGQEAGGLEGIPGDSTPFTMASVGVGDRAMVVGSVLVRSRNAGMVLADEVVETTIDATTGAAPRLRETSRYADRLTEIVDEPTLGAGLQFDPAMVERLGRSASGPLAQVVTGLRAGGLGVTVEGETSTVTLVGLYEDPAAAESADLDTLVEGIRERVVDLEAVESIDATYNGGAAVVTVDGDTRSLLESALPLGSGAGPRRARGSIS